MKKIIIIILICMISYFIFQITEVEEYFEIENSIIHLDDSLELNVLLNISNHYVGENKKCVTAVIDFNNYNSNIKINSMNVLANLIEEKKERLNSVKIKTFNNKSSPESIIYEIANNFENLPDELKILSTDKLNWDMFYFDFNCLNFDKINVIELEIYSNIIYNNKEILIEENKRYRKRKRVKIIPLMN